MQTIDKPEASSIASDIDKTPLTPAEAKALSEYEQIIRTGLDTFVEVGNALYKIANQRLYRTTYATFELYCRDKWKFTARHANRLMLAAAVNENLESDQLVRSKPIAIPKGEFDQQGDGQLALPRWQGCSRQKIRGVDANIQAVHLPSPVMQMQQIGRAR